MLAGTEAAAPAPGLGASDVFSALPVSLHGTQVLRLTSTDAIRRMRTDIEWLH